MAFSHFSASLLTFYKKKNFLSSLSINQFFLTSFFICFIGIFSLCVTFINLCHTPFSTWLKDERKHMQSWTLLFYFKMTLRVINDFTGQGFFHFFSGAMEHELTLTSQHVNLYAILNENGAV